MSLSDPTVRPGVYGTLRHSWDKEHALQSGHLRLVEVKGQTSTCATDDAEATAPRCAPVLGRRERELQARLPEDHIEAEHADDVISWGGRVRGRRSFQRRRSRRYGQSNKQ